MRLVVLGGTHFLGRAVCVEAQRRGYDVVVFNRGLSGPPPRGAMAVRGDRTSIADLRDLAKLIDQRGGADMIIDPACTAPSQALTAARTLRDTAPSYAVVSSVTAHTGWPAVPVEASSPVYDTRITAGPSDDPFRFGPLKAGVETAVRTIFGDVNSLIVRPGVMLGPWEDLGRLPEYLRRAARGGKFLMGGHRDHWFQYVDVRDVATFLLDCAVSGRPGVYDVMTDPGSITWGDFAAAIASAAGGTPVFVPDHLVEEAGVEPWRGLPLWLPESAATAGVWSASPQAAIDAGFRARPLRETVDDTWTWLQEQGPEWQPSSRRRVTGLDPDVEQYLLSRSG